MQAAQFESIDIDQLVASYQKGISMKKLGQAHGVSEGYIRRLLVEQGVTIVTSAQWKHKHQQVNLTQIVADYQSGINLGALSNKYRLAVPTVKRLLVENGVVLRTITQALSKYTVDEHFLDQIDTEVKAYWLGFMYADGYNSQGHRNHYKVVLTLQARDRHILERFSQELQLNRPLRIRRVKVGQDQLTLEFNHKGLSTRLAELGCHQAKTFTLTFPEWMPENLMPHFIRGYIDGDGWISYKAAVPKNSRFCVVGAMGTTAFITRLADVITLNCGVTGGFRKHPKSKGIINYTVSGRDQASTVLAWLYKDATIYLERKKRKAEQILVPNIIQGKPNGSDCHLSALSEADVMVIKSRILAGERFSVIADDYGNNSTCIADIASGRTWHHLTGWNDRNNVSPGNLKGSQHMMAKLTEEDVLRIKVLIQEGMRNIDIAPLFKVTRHLISKIRRGEVWEHVTGWSKGSDSLVASYSKLTEADVRRIKHLLQQGVKGSVIARQYSVAKTCISAIKNGRVWTHVTGWSEGQNAGTDINGNNRRKRPILTQIQVLEIKERIVAGEVFKSIAEHFNVSDTCIGTIAAGKSRQSVTGWSKRENAARGVKKGGGHYAATLTDEQVREIKRLIQQGEKNVSIAAEFSVDRNLISAIRIGAIWAHIEWDSANPTQYRRHSTPLTGAQIHISSTGARYYCNSKGRKIYIGRE